MLRQTGRASLSFPSRTYTLNLICSKRLSQSPLLDCFYDTIMKCWHIITPLLVFDTSFIWAGKPTLQNGHLLFVPQTIQQPNRLECPSNKFEDATQGKRYPDLMKWLPAVIVFTQNLFRLDTRKHRKITCGHSCLFLANLKPSSFQQLSPDL